MYKRENFTSSNPPLPSFRFPISEGKREAILQLSTSRPAQTTVTRHFALEVPIDCDIEGELTIRVFPVEEIVEARITELLPTVSLGLEMRLHILIETIVASALGQLKQEASDVLLRDGYL